MTASIPTIIAAIVTTIMTAIIPTVVTASARTNIMAIIPTIIMAILNEAAARRHRPFNLAGIKMTSSLPKLF